MCIIYPKHNSYLKETGPGASSGTIMENVESGATEAGFEFLGSLFFFFTVTCASASYL